MTDQLRALLEQARRELLILHGLTAFDPAHEATRRKHIQGG